VSVVLNIEQFGAQDHPEREVAVRFEIRHAGKDLAVPWAARI
jgi:hypothetical protein